MKQDKILDINFKKDKKYILFLDKNGSLQVKDIDEMLCLQKSRV